MARDRRMIARTSFRSKKLAKVTAEEHLLFYGLILEADDEGYGEGDPFTISILFGNRRWTENRIKEMMHNLFKPGLVDWYTINGDQFYEVINFLKYQGGSWHGISAKASIIPKNPAQEHHTRWTTPPDMVTPSTTSSGLATREVKISKEKIREEKLIEVNQEQELSSLESRENPPVIHNRVQSLGEVFKNKGEL